MRGMIAEIDHAGLPSKREDWPALSTYYQSLGLEVREVTITDPAYDYIGEGPRLQVLVNGRLLISFFLGDHLPHVGLRMSPLGLTSARAHPAASGETHWGYSNTSVFHDPHDGASHKVELVTTNPDYHRQH
ncbi:hypothetical protein HY631_01160 [Candidatus Uhrbacteria bacterium]|nr:hypothetical protein [Candidatus Uhrbacteria bacterium]